MITIQASNVCRKTRVQTFFAVFEGGEWTRVECKRKPRRDHVTVVHEWKTYVKPVRGADRDVITLTVTGFASDAYAKSVMPTSKMLYPTPNGVVVYDTF